MFERIYIPTVNRVNNQITYNSLPDSLKERVVFVVQAWEREKYSFPAEYLVLPPDIKVGEKYALAKTRAMIYYHGVGTQYCVFDDDLRFYRRNTRYWSSTSNMEKSKRLFIERDFYDMFDFFESALKDNVSVGCTGTLNKIPTGVQYRNNACMAGAFFIDGTVITKEVLDTIPLTSVNTAEDVLFTLALLTKGHSNILSEEFLLDNGSGKEKKLVSDFWESVEQDGSFDDYTKLMKLFPSIITIVNNTTGYKGFCKTRISWKKAYELGQANKSCKTSLKDFFL